MVGSGCYADNLSMVRLRNPCLLAFLALLWFGATFVYFGDTGKYSDDWWTASRRVDGGGIDWSCHPWQTSPYFWRPLHLIHIWTVNTIFWRHDWVGHLELALVHAGVCFMLYRLLVRLGSQRGPAMAAAVLFGTCPLLGEATLWYSASCNAIGSLLMLFTLDLGFRYGSELQAPAARTLIVIALLSFATACFYEPSAAGLAAMPILVWIAGRRAAGVRARGRETVLATIAAGIPCAVYAALLVGTSPPGARGTLATVGNLEPIQHSLRNIAGSFVNAIVGPRGREIFVVSVEQGIAAAREQPFVLMVIIATTVAGVSWLIVGARMAAQAPLEGNKPVAAGGGARGQLLLLGIVLMLASWTPFIAQHDKDLAPRSLYVPLLGLAFFVAAAGNALCRLALLQRGVGRIMAAGAIGALAIVGQVGLVGVQKEYRGSARHDGLVAEQLAMVSARVEPETVFMILGDEYASAATSRPGYNAPQHTALRDAWAATTFLRLSMHRGDVRVLTGNYTGRSPVLVDHLSSEGVRDTGGGKGRSVPWADIVPLWIDAGGRVYFVETLTIVPLGGSPLEIRAVRAERLARTVSGATANGMGGKSGWQKHIRLVELPSGKSRVIIDADGIPAGPGMEGTR